MYYISATDRCIDKKVNNVVQSMYLYDLHPYLLLMIFRIKSFMCLGPGLWTRPDPLKIGSDALMLLFMRAPRRLPLPFPRPYRSYPLFPRRYSNQLAVTDPLVIYQNLVDSDLLQPDEAQFRAAVE
jgi:hypothetical protein